MQSKRNAPQTTQTLELAELYRFASFGRLASGIFHDMSNPLTTVSLSLNELKDKKISADLRAAIEGTAQMQRFIEAARKQVQQQEELSFFSLTEEISLAISILGYKARRLQVELKSEVATSLVCFGNPLKFQQIITNLVSNAIDAYESTACGQLRQVTICTKQHCNRISIRISDHGCGIAPDSLEAIFKPFFTTKSSDKGTGIGLAIVKEYVEQDFKGSISVKSLLGYGTTFTLKLPQNRVDIPPTRLTTKASSLGGSKPDTIE